MTGKDEQTLLVTALVIADGDRVLVARRGQGRHLAGYWEFPGGKIEEGESPEECLRRELSEELEVEVDVGELLCRSRHSHDDRTIMLLAYEARLSSGPAAHVRLRLNSHDAVRWLTVPELLETRLAPADRPIAEHLLARNVDLKQPRSKAGAQSSTDRR